MCLLIAAKRRECLLSLCFGGDDTKKKCLSSTFKINNENAAFRFYDLVHIVCVFLSFIHEQEVK